jgi:hypothetical protein
MNLNSIAIKTIHTIVVVQVEVKLDINSFLNIHIDFLMFSIQFQLFLFYVLHSSFLSLP